MKPYSGLLSLDPGKTTGWAVFGNDAKVVEYGQADMNAVLDLDKLIVEYTLSHIVYEDFKLFRHKALKQVGSRFEASQVIGMAKSWARKYECVLVSQPSDIKPIAQKWSQVEPPSNHSLSHGIDAYNHGFYWLVRAGLRKTYLEEESEREKNLRASEEEPS